MAKTQKRATRNGRGETAISRVYFVGAGLSAGVGYPIGARLMEELVEFLQGRTPASHQKRHFQNVLRRNPAARARGKQIVDVITRVLDNYFNLPLQDVGVVDIAEFFTLAHTLADTPTLFGTTTPTVSGTADLGSRPPSEGTLFQDLAAATRTYFNGICISVELPADIRSVLRGVDPDCHAIINFNWDEELDVAFAESFQLDLEYTVRGWAAGTGVLMLKPHGSIGWYDLHRGIGNADLYYVAEGDDRLDRAKRRILAYHDAELPEDINGEEHPPLECPPVLTPPTFAKRFFYQEQQLIWQDVLQVCSKAYEFVFLGYSMPKDDLLTRAAIRRALKGNVDRGTLACAICDRSFDAAKLLNFQSVFGDGLTRRNYLEATFGQEKKTLGAKLQTFLSQARLLS